MWFDAQTRARGLEILTAVRGSSGSMPAPPIRRARKPPLIMVADDEEETRDGIEKLLLADGYRVVPVRSEDDAVHRASRRRPDLILVSFDGSPPQVTASAVRIRRRAGLDDRVPVVVFCVPTLEEGAEVDLGYNVHATLPDNFDQLRVFLRRLLGDPP
jgi:CheY-like chemotaxis protein